MTSLMVVPAVLFTTLVAGLFAAFSYAVMPALRRVDDVVLVRTMQAINRAILNPVFLTLFLGALVLDVVVTARLWSVSGAGVWALAGTVAYAATVVVTIARNVPLNDALDLDEGTPAEQRAAFEVSWTRWNHVRTATSVTAAACLLVALTRC